MSEVQSWPQDQSLDRRYRFYALIWLVYVVFPVIYLFGPLPAWRVLLGAVSIAVFVALYVTAYTYRPPSDGRILWVAASITAISLGNAVYVGQPFLGIAIYAAVIAARLHSDRLAYAAIILCAALIALVGSAIGVSGSTLFSLVLVALLSSVALRGFLRFYESARALHHAQQEITRLAKEQERTRIARDLHDILGHSLSVVVLKSELAAALLQRSEYQSVQHELSELQTVARAALAEVRDAVAGYRQTTLQAEVQRAPSVLAMAGITCTVQGAVPMLLPEQESVLALVLREAVTNVVRHSAARRCCIGLDEEDGQIILTVCDDGQSPPSIAAGHGLRGMTERLAAEGGALHWESGDGFTIKARMPRHGAP